MSIRDRVAAQLPYLRRYARALTGSQASGDAYVRAVLEGLVQGGPTLDRNLSPRVALYKAFHDIWSGPARVLHPGDPGREAGTPEERIQVLSPLARQALLLTALEGFSFREIGAILNVSPEHAEQLAADAQLEIERDLATDVLVIEDEAVIAMDIKELAEELGHRVIDIARTRDEAVASAARHTPGLVMADIRLADDSSGVDAVRDILTRIDAPIVFVTAYPERLLTGDRPEPTYLVTKPFDRLSLKATIGQALFFHRKNEAA